MTYTPKKLKEFRYTLGLTQAEFAARLGYSTSHVAQAEGGQRNIGPRMEFELDKLKAEVKQ